MGQSGETGGVEGSDQAWLDDRLETGGRSGVAVRDHVGHCRTGVHWPTCGNLRLTALLGLPSTIHYTSCQRNGSSIAARQFWQLILVPGLPSGSRGLVRQARPGV